MTEMHRLLLACLLAHLPALAQSQAPFTADVIMARVAANQDRSEAERTHFVYLQHARVASRKGKTVRCEEITDTRITPTDTGSRQELIQLDGRLLLKGQYLTYNKIPPRRSEAAPHKDQEDDLSIQVQDDGIMDRDLVENLRDNLTNSKSKDGIGKGLFPLTSKTQAEYNYHLRGTEHRNGREVFHLTFEPKDKDDYGWRGDAYIDTTAFQPVVVRTTMARKIPFAVRTMLGTSLPGLGFTVVYAPQLDNQSGGLWFPISFGTEFKMRILFFINRDITLSAENRDFEKTHVTSTIVPVTSP